MSECSAIILGASRQLSAFVCTERFNIESFEFFSCEDQRKCFVKNARQSFDTRIGDITTKRE